MPEQPSPETPDTAIERAAWAMWSTDGAPTGVAKRDPYRKLARALDAEGLLAPCDAEAKLAESAVWVARYAAESEQRAAERDEARATLAKIRGVLARGLEKARGPYQILANVEAALDGRDLAEPKLAHHITIRREDLERTEPDLVDVIAAEQEAPHLPQLTRCCVGSTADGAHALNCPQRCQDCGGDVDGPNQCRCRDAAEHADDCQGCDGPGVVPCEADEVRGNVAYRNGKPIKNLRAEADRG